MKKIRYLASKKEVFSPLFLKVYLCYLDPWRLWSMLYGFEVKGVKMESSEINFKENCKIQLEFLQQCTKAIWVHPPLGLVQVWQVISQHQIIVQTWNFLWMTWTLVRMNGIFVLFLKMAEKGKNSLNCLLQTRLV